jgi:FMN phosphatase YigB (HAD superfamily)
VFSLLQSLEQRLLFTTTKVVVWDFDGTFFDGKKIGTALKAQYLKLLQRKNKTFTNRDFEKLLMTHQRWSTVAMEVLGLNEFEIVGMIEQGFSMEKYLVKNKPLVAAIKKLAHHQHLILTNASASWVRIGLQKIGFAEEQEGSIAPFDAIIDRHQTGVLKPHRRAFEKVLEITARRPEEHLMIGDSFREDIEPAAALGFKTLAIEDACRYLGFERL